jgi:integrase
MPSQRFLSLITANTGLSADDWHKLDAAIAAWARKTTDATTRRHDDLIRDKQKVVYEFFRWVDKRPHLVTSADVSAWQDELRSLRDPNTRRVHYQPATLYAMLNRVSSFYRWAQQQAKAGSTPLTNPVDAIRPKAPKAYQTKMSKGLTDDEMQSLVGVVKAKADGDDIVGQRDYAMLMLYLVTGLRREEVVQIKWGDIKLREESLLLSLRLKGGDMVTREVVDPAAIEALRDYITASRKLRKLTRESSLWTRHDYAGKAGAGLTSHAFVANMKRYAKQAGLDHFHLHQTRHTFARIVAEDSGSLIITQDALGHANPQTTRIYVQRIGIKRDHHSSKIAARLKPKKGK